MKTSLVDESAYLFTAGNDANDLKVLDADFLESDFAAMIALPP